MSRYWYACLLLAFLISPTSFGALPPGPIVLAVILNGESKGDYIVQATADGDLLFRRGALEALGVTDPGARIVQIEGEAYLSLRSLKGAQFRVDEKTLSLEVTVSPELLPRQVLDFRPPRRQDVLRPEDNSAFLNYGLRYSDNDTAFESWDLSLEAGVRIGSWLFLSDHSYTRNDSERKHVRLMTSLTQDRRDTLQRLRIGDFFAFTGNLASSLNLGGVSFSKEYRIDPYLLKQPLADLTGSLAIPSEVEIYLDGARIKTESLAAGEFELQNLTYYGGARDIEIRITDRFGREERIVYPYYFTDQLLQKGLHEYSYNAGFIREEFGIESNAYGKFALSSFHRYGVSDALTIGFNGEATRDVLNLGGEGLWRGDHLGLIGAGISLSRDHDAGTGVAGSLSYTYQSRNLNGRLLARGYSNDYATINRSPTGDRPKLELAAGIGFYTRSLGNIGLDHTHTKLYEAEERRTTTLRYSRSLATNLSLNASLSRIGGETDDTQFFLGFSYSLGKDRTLTYLHQDSDAGSSETLQLTKSVPVGEGFGYRVAAQKSGDSESFYPYLRYNGKHGIYTAEYRSDSRNGAGTNETYTFSTAGAVGWVGSALGFSRPIYDSFALVKVGELEGVRVYRNNREIGKTDASGSLFLPELNAYTENHIAIEDKDIPIEYVLAGIDQYISPPLRSGSLVAFDISRFQAITGRLKIRVNGETRPVEYTEAVLDMKGKSMTFPTIKGGEFYLENVSPGAYPVTFRYANKECSVVLQIPESEEMIVELGEVNCE